MTVQSNYQRWDKVNRHDTVGSFAEALQATAPSGVHAISLSENITLDVLVRASSGPLNQSIPVFFNDSVSKREERTGPFFSGEQMDPVAFPVTLAVSDPSVDRSVDVPLGWYAGYEGSEVVALVLDVLRAVSDAWGKELVLVGGSGGGFAALRFASLLNRPVSAFVWNPQTDILAYNRVTIDRYLTNSFPSLTVEPPSTTDWLTDRRTLCDEVGIGHSLVGEELHSPQDIDRLVYLQNVHDWHLAAHAIPYLKHHGFWDLGTGSRVLDPEHVVQVGDWGAGHAPLPHDLLASALGEFLNGRTPSLDIARAVALDATCDATSLTRAPKDLRGVGARLLKGATAASDPDWPIVTITLPREAPEPGYGGLRFGLVQAADGRRGQLVWFKETDRLEYDPDSRWGDAVLSVAVRDGMNHHLGEIPVTALEAVSTPAASTPAAARAFIYGSCVTRDAFQLGGLPRLADYYARSPIISAFGRRPAELPAEMDLEAIPSAFQRRMVTRDVEKSLPAALAGLTSRNVVIIDLIDERISVAQVEGGVLACSSEAAKAGLRAGTTSRLAVGEPGFMTAWERAADHLVNSLRGRRVILNKVFWATRDETGADLSERFPVELHNQSLQHMYRRLEVELSCDVVEYPEELLVADSQHRWGLSPFHFIEAFYAHFVTRVQEITG